MSATLLYDDTLFLQHDTGRHVESPERISRVRQTLSADSVLPRHIHRIPTWKKASSETIHRIHTPSYLRHLTQFAEAGGGQIEQDTIVSPRSVEVARYASGAACDAVMRIAKGEAKRAFCLIRPPGHHALADGPMGFCLLNHVAIAAEYARAVIGIDRVLIIDWDVHHGNGTQEIFWSNSQVAFLSIHRWPFYPGTGRAEETGTGPGLGTTRNVPIAMGTDRSTYCDRFQQGLESITAHHQPDLIFISAGFDAHRDDPIGSLGLGDEDFETLTRCVRNIADVHCNGRIVSLLEGGYDPEALARCVRMHLHTLGDDS